MWQLAAILIALLTGYFTKVAINRHLLDKLMIIAVMAILVVIGYGFGSDSTHLLHDMSALVEIISVFTLLLLIFNCLSIGAIFYLLTRRLQTQQPTKPKGKIYLRSYILESLKYLLLVVVGMTLGYIIHLHFAEIDIIVNTGLLAIVFVLGMQLRAQNVPLIEILANKAGWLIAGVIIFSSIIAGLCSALVLGLKLKTALVLSSGFGWYSLTAILTGELINHQFGIAAFFIDFSREIIAIVLVPLLGRVSPFSAIGYSGATALSFTLPIIKVNLGDRVLPVAVASGMILTLVVPILITLFWNL